MKTKKIKKVKLPKGFGETNERVDLHCPSIERIRIALLDLALAVEEGSWQGIYQQTAQTLHPIPTPKKKIKSKKK